MTIKNVELIHKPEVKPGTMQDGLPVAASPEVFAFRVFTEEMVSPDDEIIIPNDPLNSHYQEVREWYEAQDEKPFKFNFERTETLEGEVEE